jgi:hypothetical protein
MAEHTAVEVSVLEREYATIVIGGVAISAEGRLRDALREIRALNIRCRGDAFAADRPRRRPLQLIIRSGEASR